MCVCIVEDNLQYIAYIYMYINTYIYIVYVYIYMRGFALHVIVAVCYILIQVYIICDYRAADYKTLKIKGEIPRHQAKPIQDRAQTLWIILGRDVTKNMIQI